MNILQLRYFVAVAQKEHYGHAAAELYITQPALSNSIKRLEREIGFPLFNSAGRNVMLTPEGKVFLDHVTQSLGILNSGIIAAQEHYHKSKQTIHVGSVASLLRGRLSSFLNDFAEFSDDNVEFDISLVSFTQELLSKLVEGNYDAVFCGQPVGEPSLSWIPLFPQDAVAIVHESHPLADKKIVSIEDIRPYPQLSYRPPCYMYYAFKNMFAEYGLTPEPMFDDDISALSVVAVTPQCVGIAIDSAKDCLWDSVRMLQIEEFLEPYHYVGMAYMTNKDQPPGFQGFKEYAERYSRENIHGEAIERRYYR